VTIQIAICNRGQTTPPALPRKKMNGCSFSTDSQEIREVPMHFTVLAEGPLSSKLIYER
jgi:hypothetical protein